MKYFSAIIAVVIFLSSCKNDKSNEELILGDWNLAALTTDPPIVANGVVITDFYAQPEDCDKDNIYTYNSNKTYKFDEGNENCDSPDPQNVSGNWEFLNKETELRVIYQNDTIVYDLIDLDEELLKLDYSGRDSNNILHTFSATFEHF